MSTSPYQLKYLAWLLPAATLLLTVSVSGRVSGQRGQPAVASSTQVQSPPPQGGAPPRMGGPQSRPGSGWGEWWKDELVKKELALTADQVRQIDRIYAVRSRRVQAFADDVPKQRAEMVRMLQERTVDEATFGLQVSKFEHVFSRFNEARNIMQYAFYLELTPEQYKELLEIRERGRGGRGGRGGQ